MKSLFRGLGILLLATCMGACSGDGEEPLPAGSLAALAEELGLPIQQDSLIACAASGQHGFLQESSGEPVSVIYLPVPGSGETWYFETNGPVSDKTNFREYQQRNMEDKPLLNGFLRKFAHPGSAAETIGIVATVNNGKLFLSNPINIKMAEQPTGFNTTDMSVDLTEPLMPDFTWPESTQGEDAIYFHVVSDAGNNLISGTYSYDRNFRFYDLSNVVLNIHDTDPAPQLLPNEAYTFSVLAVSLDNWVNAYWVRDFRTD